MVGDMRSRISLFVIGLSRLSSKEGRAAMLIGDMDISRLMVYVQQVEEENLRDREEFRNKKPKTENESGQQKSNVNHSIFQQKQKGPATSYVSAPAPKNKGCLKCGQEGHFMKECPKNRKGSGNQGNRAQSSSVAPPDKLHLEELLSGVMRFGKKGKLSPSGSSSISCLHVEEVQGDPSIIIPTEDIGIKDSLSYEEIPVQILDRQVRKLRTKELASVKLLWRNQFVEEATWEAEKDMKKRYPHLFESREVPN
ncbi:hypothetical protein MTR67_025635 [Solanum verrucosum]|uniref:CCHC-type domain-containing protein n=1 Tax=Solanum verrucosum TaxID=315347 RepID=A0AAF0R3W4_SOLVR|nr:hypothetical protein MTR67_025635 [Solanum verrucosum]